MRWAALALLAGCFDPKRDRPAALKLGMANVPVIE